MSFKDFEHVKLTEHIKNINQEKLDIDIKDLLDNDIILIKSGTATGKTKNIGKLSKELKENTKCKILSVVNLKTLADEQIKTFKEESNTILKDYQTELKEFNNNDGVICINSIFKLHSIDYDFSNVILYIDEVNDLIKSLTHNDGMDKTLNKIYMTLTEIIKKCKKIILSDATIDINTLNLISARKTNNKILLINNSHKKFKGIKAIKYNDENKFIEKLKDHIKNKKYFLFGCDICAMITDLYNMLVDLFPDQKEDFILITGDTTFRPKNANVDFKNKYVFYSPSITTGVSFVYEGTKQTQFLYISDKTLITPISLYQMSSRTRNMKELIFFSKEIKNKEPKFNALEEYENKYSNIIQTHNKVLNMSKSINEDDEITIVKNPFFKMFCYNEYQMDTFKTGFIQHFKNILIGNGFEYEEDGEYKQLVKAEKNKIENFTQVIKDKEFNEYVNTALIEFETEEQVDKFEKIQQKYKNLHARIRLLNIGSKEDAIEYKEFLTNEYLLNDYYNFLNLFKTNENIIKKYEERKQETLNIKLINCIYSKILLLKKFEEHYKIKRFQLDFKNVDCKKEINEDFKSLYQNMFPKKNIKLYETTEQLQKIYINLIKMICGELKIITSKRIQKDKKRTHEYNLNKEVISDLIKLCKLNNPELHNYNIKLIEEITGILPDKQN